jgi:hypothetical protein
MHRQSTRGSVSSEPPVEDRVDLRLVTRCISGLEGQLIGAIDCEQRRDRLPVLLKEFCRTTRLDEALKEQKGGIVACHAHGTANGRMNRGWLS